MDDCCRKQFTPTYSLFKCRALKNGCSIVWSLLDCWALKRWMGINHLLGGVILRFWHCFHFVPSPASFDGSGNGHRGVLSEFRILTSLSVVKNLLVMECALPWNKEALAAWWIEDDVYVLLGFSVLKHRVGVCVHPQCFATCCRGRVHLFVSAWLFNKIAVDLFLHLMTGHMIE